ncbi:type I polyketide synthase [Haloechinothrix halophila]|uniref:type I polyketide synthase n=1 Tax=Haloechinothrix halophila TaxID=1069073 RepID=UPI0004109E2F|nr:type I polyketide synthase [Haloechinothrix halophila]
MSADRIAIVGLACRYPDAADPAQLWQNVLAKRQAFRRLPDTRLGQGYRDEHAPDATYLTRAAVLRDWTFDRERFGVPGPLYRAADHTHWLALETAAAALADAGAPGGDGLERDTTGVVLGNSLTGEFSRAGLLRLRWPFLADATATALHDAGLSDDTAAEVLGRLEALVKEPFPAPGDETLSGALANTIAGRVCNYFDFHGTGYTVDGACSSSLLAVAAACRALVAGECDFMLAGGVDLSLDPLELVGFSRLGALATGDMRVYDAHPTGFLPGEGCGVVALMRASDAEKRGLRTYAHIIGWASSSDGSGGLTRPELSGQAMALHRAYRAAGIAPEQARLVEGHGTGTAIGDRVELSALSSVRGADAPPAALGSIKANLGHTKAAAGAASLIKATLAAHHRVLPPTTGCERPHDLLRDAPLRVLAEAEPWPDETPRAGVSAMGFGGINVHVVLENPEPHAAAVPASTHAPWPALSADAAWSRPRGQHEIVPLAADTPDALAERLSALAEAATALSIAEVGDIAATAWHSGDGEGRYRAMLVAATPDELVAAAAAAASRATEWNGDLAFDRRAGYALGSTPVRVGLLFPGQAAPVRAELPWWADGLDVPALAAERARSTSDDAAVTLDATSAIATEVAQPAIVRQSLAALAWLDAIGCEAIGACGHSLGEITGLHWAGACTASTALDLATLRGRLMAEHALDETIMAGLATSAATAEDLIAGTEAVLACHNAPERIVVAGPVDDVERVLDRAHARGIAASRLPVSHGFHSPAMQPVAGPLRTALADVALDTVRDDRPLLSTITGGLISEHDLRGLLVDQLTQPVRFADAVTALAARCDLLLETGPGIMLTDLVAANDFDVPALSVDSGGEPHGHAFATAVLAATGNGSLTPWFTDRPYRTLDWRDTPRFLANPCETPRNRTTPAPSTSGVVPASGTDEHDGENAEYSVSGAGHGVLSAGHSVPSAGHDVLSAGHDPLRALTQHLATVLELSAEAIEPSMSLLRDLHMTSIQVVDAVGAAATRLGKQPPATPLSLSDATVAEAAEVLADLPSTTDTARPATPTGVRGWVRQFEPVWLPFNARTGTSAPDGTRTVTLPDNAGPATVAALLAEITDSRPRMLRIVHAGHHAAQGVGRSIAAELPDCQVVVLERPDTTTDPGDAGLGHPDRYLELRAHPDGTLERAALRARPPRPRQDSPGNPPLPEGVCLVTGGMRGITAYAAAELATGTGTTLVFVGRTPADDPDITAALRDLTDSGHTDVHYLACDVTDPASVTAMLTEARAHGTITGIIHGAGINEPRPLDEVTAESFATTLAPKVDGLRTLLETLGDMADDLRLLLGFGSIIGRQGLAGQAEYCVANDWLRHDIETWARAHPHCRTHLLEWSVWSGVGMGVRLGVLDTLRRHGVEPIGTREGVDALRDVLADPQAPVTVLITARFPDTTTMHLAAESAPLLRFGEHVRARIPGVEAITQAELSLGSDPYLDDHRIDGTPVLPAVVAMEAMAQTASHVDTVSLPISLSHLEFRAAITLNGPDPRTIQVAALADRHGTDVVVRDDSDATGSDRFSGTLVTAPEPPAPQLPSQPPPPSPDAGPHECYDTTFFHTGRFRRLLRYDLLSAFRVRAWIRAEQGNEAVPWFSAFHSGRLLLGDPGAHDATLHVLLACVPHRRALPVGVDRVTVWREPTGVLRVDAVETSHTHDDYVFDVMLSQPDGTVVAHWQGLRLHATTPPQRKGTLPVRLVGPWLSRRLIECGLHEHVELLTAPGRRKFGAATGLLQQLTGGPAGHDLAGAPRVDGSHASASYAHNTLLLGVSDEPVGVDWESVPATPAHAGAVPCDAADHPVAEILADKLGEDPTLARLRVWTAREALSKLGYGQSEPLRIDRITEDGLTILRAGVDHVVTAKVHTTDTRGAQVKVAAVACPKEPKA